MMVPVIDVTQLPDEQRYVITVDGERVGLLDYELDGDVFVALHTEVDPSFGGQGLGAELVTHVLDEVRASGRRLRPRCPFVRHFLRDHPTYRDLVEPVRRDGSGA
jgi:predicted GNAT family acetyltransferase